jgi:hypothetical protein
LVHWLLPREQIEQTGTGIGDLEVIEKTSARTVAHGQLLRIMQSAPFFQ